MIDTSSAAGDIMVGVFLRYMQNKLFAPINLQFRSDYGEVVDRFYIGARVTEHLQ